MAINTGPDSNKYEIPEVVVSNTFNTWKDLSNLNTYKLNKLRVYSGLSGDSIGLSTAETDGVLTAVLLPTVITGHTFSAGIKGTTAAFNALNAYGTGLVIGSNATAITMGVAGGSANILSNVTITGNLNVTGTRTQTSSADFVIADSVISLGQTGSVGVTGANAHAQDRGIAFFYPDTAASIGASLGFFGPKAGSRNFVYLLNGSTSATNIHSGVTGTFQGNFLGGDATLEKLVVGGTLDVVGIANFRGGVTFSGGITLTVGATLSTRSSIVFSDGTTKQVGFRAPSNITTSAVWTLPVSPGSAGQVLTTDAGSTLSWTTPAVGGSNTQVLFNSSGSVSGDSGLIYTAAGGLTATKISATASLSSNSTLLVGPSVNIASNPSNTLATASIVGSAFTTSAFNSTLGLYGTDGLAVGKGAGIMFGGGYTSANANLLTTWAEVSGVRENATDGLYDGALVFKTRATNVNAAERVRITSTGRVGIGTATPVSVLDVKDTISNAAQFDHHKVFRTISLKGEAYAKVYIKLFVVPANTTASSTAEEVDWATGGFNISGRITAMRINNNLTSFSQIIEVGNSYIIPLTANSIATLEAACKFSSMAFTPNPSDGSGPSAGPNQPFELVQVLIGGVKWVCLYVNNEGTSGQQSITFDGVVTGLTRAPSKHLFGLSDTDAVLRVTTTGDNGAAGTSGTIADRHTALGYTRLTADFQSSKLLAGSVTIGGAPFAAPSGTAPIFGARAYVSYSPAGTYSSGVPLTRNASGNVSSVTAATSSTQYIAFTTPMPSANYTVTGNIRLGATDAVTGAPTQGTAALVLVPGLKTVNGFYVNTMDNSQDALISIFTTGSVVDVVVFG